MKNQLPYSELLRDPRWIEKRNSILTRDDNQCRFCGEIHNLDVHHLIYKKGLLPWEYNDRDLLTICRHCHKDVSGLIDQSIDLVRQISCFPDAAENLLFLLTQLVGLNPYQIRSCGKIIRNTIYEKSPEIDTGKFAPGIEK